jgi:hypothetical protein
MQEDIANPPIEGYEVKSFFVHYDNDGKVYLVSNVKDESLNNFEISIDLIPNFIRGIKDCTKYKIDYFFNISAGLISDTEEQEDLIKTDYILYEIPKKDLLTYDVLFEYNITEKVWTATTTAQAADRLTIVSTVPFYVCKKDNPCFLIAEYIASATDLINGPVSFEFTSDMELDFSNISVYTIKKFRDYCVKEKYVQ